ncbi:hypothetical protein [Hyphococcus sp. DH-69]|uniref:hypothetical protein n=1 Tax=Hyphococcus formosus TaxID=3143534 RepID=UPI00398B0892
MRKQNYLIGIVSLFAVQACGNQAATGENEQSATTETEEVAASEDGEMSQANDCPVIASRNWNAWINAMPGPDATRSLHVTGEIDLPTPGYEIEMIAGVADRSAIPTQRLIIKATPPSGMVTQVITTESVSYSGPAIADLYRSIMVLCGDTVLTEITELQLAQ